MEQPDFRRFCARFKKSIVNDIKQCGVISKECFVNIENKYSALLGEQLKEFPENPIVVISTTKWRGCNIKISCVLNVGNEHELSCSFYDCVTEEDLQKNTTVVEEPVQKQEEVTVQEEEKEWQYLKTKIIMMRKTGAIYSICVNS